MPSYSADRSARAIGIGCVVSTLAASGAGRKRILHGPTTTRSMCAAAVRRASTVASLNSLHMNGSPLSLRACACRVSNGPGIAGGHRYMSCVARSLWAYTFALTAESGRTSHDEARLSAVPHDVSTTERRAPT
jgi:hypothetical protein